MKKAALSLALIFLAACSANGTSTLPQPQPSQPADGIVEKATAQSSTTSNTVTFTQYGSTHAFEQTLGALAIAYDGQGGLWIASETAYERFWNGHMSTETTGLGAASAFDYTHSVRFLLPMNGYVWALGFSGNNAPTLVRLSSDGSRSLIPISGLGAFSNQYIISVAAGANAIYVVWNDLGDSAGVTKLDRISTGGTVLNETVLAPSGSSDTFGSIAVAPTGEAYVYDDNYPSSRIDRYAADGTFEKYYSEADPPTFIENRGGFWSSMAFGSDGKLYVPCEGFEETGTICVLNPVTGSLATYNTPTALSYPTSAVLGSDGNIWFVEYFGNNLGRITTSGQITEYAEPMPYPIFAAAAPSSATENPEAGVWFLSAQDQDRFSSVRATF